MRHPGTRWIRLHVLLASLLLLAGLPPAALAAQTDDPGQVAFPIAAYLCDGDPGDVSVAAGNIPGSCLPAAGVWFTVAGPDGAAIGACGTDPSGMCSVLVPTDAAVTVTEDTSTFPEGTVARVNPITAQAVTGSPGVTFINIAPAPPPTEEPLPTDMPPTDVPTEEPTLAPEPTLTPTPEPTLTPTPEPTLTPTIEPTLTPTPEPTLTPTATPAPTLTPTSAPTVPPRAQAPTVPTPTPTKTPTPTPTKPPTPTPTPKPTQTPTPTPVPTKTYATVSNTGGLGLRCRTAPNTSASIIMVVAEGNRVETRGAATGGWLPVRCGGQNGWMYASYTRLTTGPVKPTPTPTTPPSGTTRVGTVTGTGGLSLRCRAEPNTSAAIITHLPEGTRVEARGAAANGWLPVRCAGRDGWVSMTYITLSTAPAANPTPTPTPKPPPTTGGTGSMTVTGTGGAGLNCRTAPVTGGVIAVLLEGSRVETRGAASNGWVPVRCGGQNGWVSGAYVTRSSSGGTPAPTPPPATGTAKVAMVSGTGGGGLNCRTGPGTNYPAITILPEGVRVEGRGDVANGWMPVRCGGRDGWVSATYLSFNLTGGGGAGELWIDVNLSTQYLIVYRGSTVIGQTYVSTGRYGFDTPTGTFYVNYKLPSQTMSGVIGGEYYNVPNVPWVMYFTDWGHALHGTYWHNNFGTRMSHGCVNLPLGFAEWLYSITPVGTRVQIHY